MSKKSIDYEPVERGMPTYVLALGRTLMGSRAVHADANGRDITGEVAGL